jgi:hypothetical protein
MGAAAARLEAVERELSSGDFGCEAEKRFTFFGAKPREHGAAVLDVSTVQPSGQPLSARGECDANDAAVVGNTAALDEPLTFEAVQGRRDGRDGCGERLSEAADAPLICAGENFEEADVIGVQVRIDAAGQQAGFDAELTHEKRNALVQRLGLLIVDGWAARWGSFLHKQQIIPPPAYCPRRRVTSPFQRELARRAALTESLR